MLHDNVNINVRNIKTQIEAFTVEKSGIQLYPPCYFQHYKETGSKKTAQKIV